jgi:hypothetical protein
MTQDNYILPISHEISVIEDELEGVFVEICFSTKDGEQYSFLFRPEVFKQLHDDMEQVT